MAHRRWKQPTPHWVKREKLDASICFPLFNPITTSLNTSAVCVDAKGLKLISNPVRAILLTRRLWRIRVLRHRFLAAALGSKLGLDDAKPENRGELQKAAVRRAAMPHLEKNPQRAAQTERPARRPASGVAVT